MQAVPLLRFAPPMPIAPTFEDAYTQELPYVWHTLRRLGVPADDREDLAHDVFLIVHRRIADFEPERPLRPWLFGIAYRVVADHRRSARVRREVLDEDPDARAVAAGAGHEARDLVLTALQALALDRRAVVILHDLEGHTAPEIAAVLDQPLNTIYSHLRRARAELATELTRLGAAPEGDHHD